MTFTKIITVLLLATSPAMAQHSHSNHGTSTVKETGQAQFASIAEIVSVLRDDPSTNWKTVDINALRNHLVDMDNVTTRSTVAVEKLGSTVVFSISGEGDVISSIQRMVSAHSPMLATQTKWDVSPVMVPDGAMMKITSPNTDDLQQILGLGFYGLMTIGAHHQQHHLMIAKGASPH